MSSSSKQRRQARRKANALNQIQVTAGQPQIQAKLSGTPQTRPLPKQVANNAGGFTFQVSDLNRLRRFICLGSEKGTYYVNEQKLSLDNAKAIHRLVQSDKAMEALQEIENFSVEGRCAKQQPLLFCYAMCARFGSLEIRRKAYEALTRICRIPTHLFLFIGYCESLGESTGWGRLHRKSIQNWYNAPNPAKLAYAVTKYAQREGWSHRDVLRLCHAKPQDACHDLVYKYVTKGFEAVETAKQSMDQRLLTLNLEESNTNTSTISTITSNIETININITTPTSTSTTDPSTITSSAATNTSTSTSDVTTISSIATSTTTTTTTKDPKVKKEFEMTEESVKLFNKIYGMLEGIECLKKMDESEEFEAVKLITKFHLAREHIPTCLLNSKVIWQALLQEMPLTALIRNLNKMTSLGLFDIVPESVKGKSKSTKNLNSNSVKPSTTTTTTTTTTTSTSAFACASTSIQNQQARHNINLVVGRLTNEELLQQARIHPFNVLVALKTYQSGHGLKGKLVWAPHKEICTALETAFYLSFRFVEPTGKRFVLALDVSGSMSGANVLGSECITAREASAAMAMVTAKTESACKFMAFSKTFVPLNINADMDLNKVLNIISGLPFSGTDCALPMTWALQNKVKADVFMVFTDNETYYGKIHPHEALKEYRARMGIDAKLIVVGMTSTRFTIADPDDSGMLDMCGFDSSAPEIVRQFVLGEI